MNSARIVVHEAVRAALHEKRAVVALESTIITHGLPHPINYKTAVAAEDAIRRVGAEPATIALIDGVAHVGLDCSQLARVAESGPRCTFKTSRASIPTVLARGRGYVGGTTVSGTMALARQAGIPIFATGGIGGVHRGAETSMDISTDLVELGRSRVAVFCSGAKSILDIPRTLEYLETQGVPIATFHPHGEFPCFYTATSGCHVPVVRSAKEAALSIAYNESLGFENGMLFGVPIPSEFEADGESIQNAVEIAVRESFERGIDRQGKHVTPWLLRRVSELAKNSVRSNVGLVINNARTAAVCAIEHASLRQTPSKQQPAMLNWADSDDKTCSNPKILVVGCAAVDITMQGPQKLHTTVPGTVRLSRGGVGFNVARAAHVLLKDPNAVLLMAPYAEDKFGSYLAEAMVKSCMRTDGLILAKQTPVCNLLLDPNGDLITGVADMDVILHALTPSAVARFIDKHRPRIVALDANLHKTTLAAALQSAAKRDTIVLFEPTSAIKSQTLVQAISLLDEKQFVQISTPNSMELSHMATALRRLFHIEEGASENLVKSLRLPQDLVQDALIVSKIVHTQFVKLRDQGVLLVTHAEGKLNMVHLPALPLESNQIVSSTGAGDSFTGAILACTIQNNTSFSSWSLDYMISLADAGQRAACQTLTSAEAVALDLELNN